MQTLIVKTDNAAHAQFLSAFLKTVSLVQSVSIERDRDNANTDKMYRTGAVNEPEVAYNWTNPSRPATDEEFEQLAFEMEQDKGEYSSKEVLNFVNEELRGWRKKKK